MFFLSSAWQAARDDKVAQREQALHSVDLIVPERPIEDDLPFLTATAPQIVANISARTPGWTATSVLHAYIRASRRAQESYNCLTDVLYSDALRQAAHLDKHFEALGTLVGPLHGVPISLKDQIKIKGHDSTLGASLYCNSPCADDCMIASMLKDQGAIPFVKTNVPQTLLAFECGNPIFGSTRNPYNANATSGGSSGGEAALIASDCSPLGIGSDIGGSIRIPSHYSGCFGLKTTSGRIPIDNLQSANPGFEGVKSVLGPMARTVEDLELAMDAIARINIEKYSKLSGPPCAPLPWRKGMGPSPGKRIGYYKSDGYVKASPACQRAVQETVDALTRQGYQCVEITPPDIVEAACIFTGITSADGYKNLLGGLRSDPKEDSIYLTTLGPSLNFITRAIGQIALWKMDPEFGKIYSESRTKNVQEYHKFIFRRNDFDRKLRQYLWNELNLDVVICPVQAVPAMEIGKTWDVCTLAGSTFVYNVVDMPSGAMPITFVDKDKDALTKEWWENGTSALKIAESDVYSKNPPKYDPERMHGQPVGIQVVCGAYEDERVIEYMKIIDNALGPRGFGPGEFMKRQAKKTQ